LNSRSSRQQAGFGETRASFFVINADHATVAAAPNYCGILDGKPKKATGSVLKIFKPFGPAPGLFGLFRWNSARAFQSVEFRSNVVAAPILSISSR
jgi:hypothetical protein